MTKPKMKNNKKINGKKIIMYISTVIAFLSVGLMLTQLKMSMELHSIIYATTVPFTSVAEDDLKGESLVQENADNKNPTEKTYVINLSSKKIHLPDCQYAQTIDEENKITVKVKNLNDYYLSGYTSCTKCLEQ